MAKLLLSLWNGERHPVDLADVLSGMDATGKRLALQAIAAYAERGEDDELRRIGKALFAQLSGYVELCEAAAAARWSVKQRWELERLQAAEAEERDQERMRRARIEKEVLSLTDERLDQLRAVATSQDARVDEFPLWWWDLSDEAQQEALRRARA